MIKFTIGQLAKSQASQLIPFVIMKIGLLERKPTELQEIIVIILRKCFPNFYFLKHCRELAYLGIFQNKTLSFNPAQTCMEVDHLIDQYLAESIRRLNLEHRQD